MVLRILYKQVFVEPNIQKILGGISMFKNLEAELKRKDFTRARLAKALNINIGSLCSKLTGKRPLMLQEAMAIKQEIFNNEFTIDYLFSE